MVYPTATAVALVSASALEDFRGLEQAEGGNNTDCRARVNK